MDSQELKDLMEEQWNSRKMGSYTHITRWKREYNKLISSNGRKVSFLRKRKKVSRS